MSMGEPKTDLDLRFKALEIAAQNAGGEMRLAAELADDAERLYQWLSAGEPVRGGPTEDSRWDQYRASGGTMSRAKWLMGAMREEYEAGASGEQMATLLKGAGAPFVPEHVLADAVLASRLTEHERDVHWRVAQWVIELHRTGESDGS